MTIFDLLFLLAALSLLVAMVIAAINAARGRRQRSLTILRRIGIAGLAYFAAIVLASAITPRLVVPLGTDQCFDDWCIAVTQTHRSGDSLTVELRLSSRARGISQGERDVRVNIVDDHDRVYQPENAGTAAPMSVKIPPLGSVTTRRTFIVPATAPHPALIVVHDWFPHCCIIGDRESLLHRATVAPLD